MDGPTLECYQDEFARNAGVFGEQMATEYKLNMKQKMQLMAAFKKLGQ